MRVLIPLAQATQDYVEQQKTGELALILSTLPKPQEKRQGLTRKQIVAQTGIFPPSKASQRLGTLRQQGKAKLVFGRYWRQA
jgi:hypothetical protein